MLDYEKLENQGVPLSRVSQCSCQSNNYGFKLLNLCKKLNISFRVPIFALKSPTIAEYIFESFDNAVNSFSISSNDSEL
jgi:hypothetical protein